MALANEAMAAIWTQHRETMYARVDTIAAALLDSSRRAEAREAAHKLAGTVGSFGFPRASELARALERMLAEGADDLARMGEMVGELRADLDDPPFVVTAEAAVPAPPEPATLPLVLLVTPDRRQRERLRVEAGRRGLGFGHVDELAQAAARARDAHPDVLVLDVDAVTENAVAIEGLALAHPASPVLVLADAPGFEARRLATRCGAAGLLDRAGTAGEIMDQVALELQRRAPGGGRVLLAGHNPAAFAALAAADLEVEVTTDPVRVWEDLERIGPALVVLGADLGPVAATELCRLLRSTSRWSAVPVVMLAGDVADAFAAGADDHVAGEVVAEQLAVRVRGHLERSRMHQALGETDALTGLQNRRTASAAASDLIRMAERLTRPVCLVEVDIDNLSQVNAEHGRIAGDAVLRRLGEALRRSFRGEDVLARWSGEKLVLGLFGMDRERGVDRMTDLGRAFSAERFIGSGGEPFSATFSAGVATYPTDGADLETLYLAADEALCTAKSEGRDRVVAAGGSHKTQLVDVAIIEDEDAASELMSHFLTERGHRCWRFSNGAGAAALLAGDVPKVRARVILLDLNMPALNGMELLGVLKRDGVLAQTKVLVVTARDDDQARADTVLLGATDYLQKPVDFDALGRAVDRALGRG